MIIELDISKTSSSVEDCANYIRERVANPSMRNGGCSIFADYEDFDKDINKFVFQTFSFLQSKFKVDQKDTMHGSTKLTNALVAIGKRVLAQMGSKYYDILDNPKTEESLKQFGFIGAILIESLEQNGYITIERDKDFSPNSNQAHQVIYITEKWCEVIVLDDRDLTDDERFVGLSFTKPSDINSLYHNPKQHRPFIKECNDEHRFDLLRNTKHLEGCNKLQQTAWRINQTVYDAAIEHSYSKPILPTIPKYGSKVMMDKSKKAMNDQLKLMNAGKDNSYEAAKAKFNYESVRWNEKKLALKAHSVEFSKNTILSAARKLVNKPEIYFYVECDYRGRVYYSETSINYQSSDLAKGLLEFAEGQVMNEDGFFWCLVHAAGSYNCSFSIEELKSIDYFNEDYITHLESRNLEDISLDKLSLHDRAAWVLKNINLIEEIAADNKIIDTAEKPYMLLAVAHEIVNYMEAQKNGVDYTTHLPLPVDATCNGLQHAAAMTGDINTASQVGIIQPSNIPSDIYVSVGQEMMSIHNDWFDNNPMPMKVVRKNFSKVGLMCRSYGAGAGSIAEGMFGEVHKNEVDEKFGITQSDCEVLARVSIEAIDNVCPSNKIVREFLQKLITFELGMHKWFDEDGNSIDSYRSKLRNDWRKIAAELGSIKKQLKSDDCQNAMDLEMRIVDLNEQLADIVSEMATHSTKKVYGNGSKNISWITPAGFPVVCDHYSLTQIKLQCSISGKRYQLRLYTATDRPDVGKHQSAIAANFVHSIDSAHGAMTFSCIDGPVANVHDSFATLPNGVDSLIKATKDTFISIYDRDDFFETMVVKNILSSTEGLDIDIPKRGELDLTNVMASSYFFS